ncbi:HNH endonuclease [Litoribacter populi]|uniref:HNH endonuclease n=1 Tax=Litoribacter populi TaxID=2598460 RepID=UPI0011803961|nr:hypothetical protein [Litoribacter populi]
MRKIAKPSIKVSAVIDDCIDNMTDIVLKSEIQKSIGVFTTAEFELENKILINELYKIQMKEEISTSLNIDELKKLYTNRLVNKQNKGRKYYDSIFVSAPNGKCPLCSQRIVRALDHYLPKSKYPIYSITPINLVPACTDCNKDKLVEVPTKGEEETLHPYFDDVEGGSWLKMEILHCKPFVIEYFVSPPNDWDELLKKRIKFHFKVYNLNELYSIHAQEEFENIRNQLTELHTSLGNVVLKNHLLDSYYTREKVNKNSWQTAFYYALTNDLNFTNGGFK